MGQTECQELLSKEEWMSTKEIADKLGQTTGVVIRSLKRLVHTRDALMKEEKYKGVWRYLWKRT